MHRTVIVGSPRESGRSASLASEIFDACIEECPDDGISVVSVSGMEIAGCIGCDRCRKAAKVDAVAVDGGAADGESGADATEGEYRLEQNPLVVASDADAHRCFMEDDMKVVREHIDAADELIVVCPVYFASVPSQLKALMDRLQPYYWSDIRKGDKRPLTLHVVGEGGDPHGFEPLIGTVRSAFSVAGFNLHNVMDWVGCIDRTGEIQLDAEETVFDG